jgi:hypothetical protein
MSNAILFVTTPTMKKSMMFRHSTCRQESVANLVPDDSDNSSRVGCQTAPILSLAQFSSYPEV